MPPGNGQAVVKDGAVGVGGGGGAATTANEQALEPVSAAGVEESVANTVNVAVPAAVGVPETTPPEDSANPAGSAPTLIEYVNGGRPPVLLKAVEYAVPTVALDSGQLLLIAGEGSGRWLAGKMESEQACDTGPPAFVAVNVKLATPTAAGTPLMDPVAANVSPAVSAPPVIVHVIGPAPVAASAAKYEEA